METARQALRHVLAETKASAKELADPRPWTRRYPLPAVGVAFALGFLLAPTGRRRASQSDGRADHRRSRRKRRGKRGWVRALDEVLGGGAIAALVRRLLQRQGRALLDSLMQQYADPRPPAEPTAPEPESPPSTDPAVPSAQVL